MKEIDREGNILVHVERIAIEGGEALEKKFYDYALACQWRRETLAELESAGWGCVSEVDSEWISPGEAAGCEVEADGSLSEAARDQIAAFF